MIEITSGSGGIADVNEGTSLTDNDVNDPQRKSAAFAKGRMVVKWLSCPLTDLRQSYILEWRSWPVGDWMHFDQLNRRAFITLIGGAAVAWPFAARAQQPAVPVIGWLSVGWSDVLAGSVAAFRKGLNEAGFVEGKNVTIEWRWEEGRYDQLPAMAAELVRRPVAVILANGGPRPARAAKISTATIPIVFTTQSDPVATGLVASLSRPGGNVTGVYSFANELGTKQLGLLRELAPTTGMIALLVNPESPGADIILKDVQMAVRSLGLRFQVLSASIERDLDAVFTSLGQQRPGALLVQNDIFLASRFVQIASTAVQHAIPTISNSQAFAAAGGLMSYGAGGPDLPHQAGLYVGRILKGEKPADLPVAQPTKFEFVINLKTAKALGLTVPPSLLAIADEVIE
jgi:putative ABC transport system substrate-binding protein